jgi:tRNA(fMet)-specific endonuclease VapC
MSLIYVLDTNIVIKYLRGDIHIWQNFDNAIIRGDEIVIPKPIDYEVRRGFYISPAPRKEAAYNYLTNQCAIVEMDETSWKQAIQVYGDLYRKGFTVGEIDILISAICLENDYTLVTNNTADFKNIDGLELEDWTKSQI